MNPLSLASRFARSLDEEDYPEAAACLAVDCTYETAGEIHRGHDAIVGSYRAHGDWAANHLDRVEYESSVRVGESGKVIVEFVDHVEHAGLSHSYRCEQVLAFDDSGLIRKITHVELPGEPEGLREF